jgi:hypothetical protein
MSANRALLLAITVFAPLSFWLLFRAALLGRRERLARERTLRGQRPPYPNTPPDAGANIGGYQPRPSTTAPKAPPVKP